MKISEAFSLIAEIAIATGNAPITKFDDCWEIRIDDRWSFAVNGHAHERPCSFGGVVPPFSAYVQFNDGGSARE